MDRKLQQRLVGILVLACFVLLIAPVLLDAEGRIPEKITNIPPQPKRPDLSHIKIVEDTAPQFESLPTPEEVEFVIEVQSQTDATIDTEQKELWSVQVASFKDPKKATEFKAALRNASLEVYVREKLLSDGTIFTQVFVGPVDSRAEAAKVKQDVKAKFGEQGLVVKFRVE